MKEDMDNAENNIDKKVLISQNVYKTKLLRTIYFENSLLGRGLGFLGLSYMTPDEKVKTLTHIRNRR